MIITPEERAEARQAILEGGVLRLADKRFAGGQTSNNKLEMDRLDSQDERRGRVLGPLTKIISYFKPDALVGVPSGGQNWADEIGKVAGFAVVELVKGDRPRTFQYASAAAKLLVAKSERLVLVEDTTTLRSNEDGVYKSLPDIRERAVACATGWARELTENRIIIPGVVLMPVIEEHIPYDLTADHQLFGYAVREEAQVG